MRKLITLTGLVLLECAVLFPAFAQSTETSAEEVPHEIDYFLKSLSLIQQANDAYEEGDYDAAKDYADQAVEYAALFDEYSEKQAAAESGAKTAQTPGQTAAQTGRRSVGPASSAARADGTFPAQYVVRSWKLTGDSFSAIAGRPWVYGDASQWRILYEANRDKLPNPDNPNLILPGMVIDIPSIRGETRQGVWTP
jgi:nucleoid-associated protein YgaU